MDRKGFLLIEVIMGLFLLGLVAVTCLPMISASINNMNLSKRKLKMVLMAESTIEQMKAFSYDWDVEVYIFDMELKELMDRFGEEDIVTLHLPLDYEDNECHYLCDIDKRNYCKDLWEIRVIISTKNRQSRISDVELFTLMAIP